MRYQRCATVFAILASLLWTATGDEMKDMRRPKKLIATGWDKPNTETLLQNLDQMEQRPFDGVVVGVEGVINEKEKCQLRAAHQNQEWKREWFQPCIDQMKSCRFKRFTDNFILVGANPGNVDWFDDEGWKSIAEHWRIAAWIAKAGRFKGILFDPEPYHKPDAQFTYTAQPERERHSFNDYYAKARERGRQVMQAVASEYPDITVFCYFLDLACYGATGQADPRPLLSGLAYGLLPPFVDGWLDEMPSTVTLVDGCEWAYMFSRVDQYLESALKIKGACQELASPENRAKYRAQVQVSFGVYLDAYSNPEGSKYFMKTQLPSRLDQLRVNVSTALRVADEYVWIYGEKYRWWPTDNKRVNEASWPEALPGCEEILGYARNPIAYARAKVAEMEKAGTLVNLARNGDFGSNTAPPASGEGPDEEWKEGRSPAGWSAWQQKESKGAFTWDREDGASGKGSARAAGVLEGCFVQSYPVKPGERYVIQAMRRLQGRGEARIRVRWQTEDGQWTLEIQDKSILCYGPRDQWGEMFSVVEIPEGVGKLVLLLGIQDQPSAEDVAWYDDVRVHRIP